MNEEPIGTVMPFAGNYAPKGWLRCDGRSVQISKAQVLFSVIGITYGGDGKTFFKLPDLKGRITIGSGQGSGLSNYQEGQQGGIYEVGLTSYQMPSHTHSFQNDFPTGASPNILNSTDAAKVPDPESGGYFPAAANREDNKENVKYFGPPTNTVNGQEIKGSNGPSLAIEGGGLPHNNIQPSLVMNYMIKYENY